MGKEGNNSFLFDSQGKINIAFILSVVFMLVAMVLVANALTITINAPGNYTYNGSRNVNFTFTPVWSNAGENVSNCSIYVNNTAANTAGWDHVINFSALNNSEDAKIVNNSLSYVNFTFSSDGNFTFNVGCFDSNNTQTIRNFSGGVGASGNKSFFIDTVSPKLSPISPEGVLGGPVVGYLNITSYANATFYVNVTDNSTRSVYMVLFSLPSVMAGGINESVNRTMTLNGTLSHDNSVYRFNISGILNISNNFTGPGPKGVIFCANDSLGRLNCSAKKDFVISGTNISKMIQSFNDLGATNPDPLGPALAFGFSEINMTYGNGTELPVEEFVNPLTFNFTFIINFTGGGPDTRIFIVGARVDEAQLGNMSTTNFSNTVTSQVQQELGTGFKYNLTFIDIGKFIPSTVSYEYGIIQLPNKFNRKLYCSGTSVSNPGCSEISQCNGSTMTLFNYTSVIPSNSACWVDSGGFGLGGDGSSTYQLSSAFTYIFVDRFSGGLGANDFSQPNVTFNTLRVDLNNDSINRSTTLTQVINFTIEDIQSTGLNLSKNESINVSITMGGSRLLFFGYTNGSSTGSNLTCNTADASFPQNTTSVWCNVTYSFNSNGTYLVNVTGRDSSNNTNAINVNGSSFKLTIDQIPPFIWNFTISNSSYVGEGSGILGGNTPETVPGSGEGIWAQGRRFFAFANVSDNLTRPFHASLQFFNISANNGAGAWQTLNATTNYTDTNITNSATSVNSTANLSYTIPIARNEFEGKNVTFRMLVNDTVGNVNSSASLKNITIYINDTYAPTVVINSTLANNSVISVTTYTVSWVINENNRLLDINISFDGIKEATSAQGCGSLWKRYDATGGGVNNVEQQRNGSYTAPSGCFGNGTHIVAIRATDIWGNPRETTNNFSVQSGSIPGLGFNLTNAEGVAAWSKAAINNTNITSVVGINLYGTDGVGSSIDRIVYSSSCDSTSVTVTNNTIIYPFNGTCLIASANRTLTVTINDTAGNSNTTVLGFLVDNVAPTITVNLPTEGQTFTNKEANFSITVLDNDQGISSLGYYLDNSTTLIVFNMTSAAVKIGAAGASVSQINTTNLTGTRSVKFTVNDTLGNVRNSSSVTFTNIGAYYILGANLTIIQNNPNNITNASFLNGSNVLITETANIDQTLKLIMAVNSTGAGAIGGANVTVSFNGSAANWNKTNEIYIWLNDSASAGHIQNNQTVTVITSIFVNKSFASFLPDNSSYFAKIRMGVPNASRFGDKVELWYFADETNLNAKTNITECSSSLILTNALETGLPCWNNSLGGNNKSVDVFIPHFSLVALVNNSENAWVNVSMPVPENGTILSMFVPNITVGPDTATCKYMVNGSTPQTMTKSGNICLGSTERFKNLAAANGVYNITFNVTDSSGNLNSYIWRFNMSDNTLPNTPNASRVLGTAVSVTTTTATITISGMNESVNVTVLYGGTVSSLSSTADSIQTDFNQSQVVSLGSSVQLTANTLYYFNVTVCDFNGNCAKNGTFNFTTSAVAATSTSTSSSDSSGGGGGAVTVSDVAASKAQIWSTIASGASISIDINKDTIAITKVAVNDVKSALSNVELDVAALTKNPVSTEAAAKVYQYLRINKKNIIDSDAGSFKITFRVPNSWLTANSLTANDVALYRFANSQWNELAAKVTGTDATYTNYEADTPGFSSFAVGVKTSVTTGGIAPVETPIVPGEAPKEEVAPPAPVEKPKPVEAPKKAPIAWVIAAVVVILGIILIVIYQQKKKQ